MTNKIKTLNDKLLDSIFGEAKTAQEIAAIKAARETARLADISACNAAREAAKRAERIAHRAAVDAAVAAEKAERRAIVARQDAACDAVNAAVVQLQREGLDVPYAHAYVCGSGVRCNEVDGQWVVAIVGAVLAEDCAINSDRVGDLIAEAFGLIE